VGKDAPKAAAKPELTADEKKEKELDEKRVQ